MFQRKQMNSNDLSNMSEHDKAITYTLIDDESDDEQIRLANERKYELKKYLVSSIKGLNNLKDTYSICNQTCARLELIIEKIPS